MTPSDPRCVIVPEALDAERLDRALTTLCRDPSALSRTRIKDLILQGLVTIDSAMVHDPARKVSAGQILSVQIPETEPSDLIPENIPLNIVYEDDLLLVLDKPAGLVVHPGAGHGQGTLVHALLHHCGSSLSGIGGVARPGIVHRLDRETSGLMIAAKTDSAHRHLAAQLSSRTLSRTYRALVLGAPTPPAGRIETSIGRNPNHRLKMAAGVKDGRAAVTRYCTASSFGKGPACTLVECALETGRTHQIRVHMAHIRAPVIGDPLYGPQKTTLRAGLRKGGYDDDVIDRICAFSRQALHAVALGFIHPGNGKPMRFESPLAPDMEELIKILK